MAKSIYKFILLIGFVICSNSISSHGILRDCLIECANSYVGIIEATNKNDGWEIETFFLKPWGFKAGTPYCALFLSRVYRDCEIPSPNSAWSPSWGRDSDAIYKRGSFGDITKSQPGDVVSFWLKSKKRIGHVGMYTGAQGNYIYTIEGNTSDMGDSGKDGVWKRIRNKTSIYTVTNYVDKS